MNIWLTYIIIFIVILFIFVFIDILTKKNVEKYGVYCGRYNLSPSTAQPACSEDSNCAWKPYRTRTGDTIGWCDNAPSTYVPKKSYALAFLDNAEKVIDNTFNIDEEILKGFI
jgi:hypothetical protein